MTIEAPISGPSPRAGGRDTREPISAATENPRSPRQTPQIDPVLQQPARKAKEADKAIIGY